MCGRCTAQYHFYRMPISLGKRASIAYTLVPCESLIAVPYRIDLNRRNELLRQPESGMGYQYLANAENTVVLNAEVAIEVDEIYD